MAFDRAEACCGRRMEMSTKGEFRAGRITGQGLLTWPNGDVYNGEFVDGERTGRGEYAWHSGAVYIGPFLAGRAHGEGIYTYADGRVYQGRFASGRKQGLGALEWPGGNRYEGAFNADQRHGLGHLRWRDGTFYRGSFAFDRQHGLGVKESPDGGLELQIWDSGELTAAYAVVPVPHCRLVVDGRGWMFDSDECINGLAHGDGTAVRMDGMAYILDGRFVLGRLSRGEVRSLALDHAE